jgi:hypothetical protein
MNCFSLLASFVFFFRGHAALAAAVGVAFVGAVLAELFGAGGYAVAVGLVGGARSGFCGFRHRGRLASVLQPAIFVFLTPDCRNEKILYDDQAR